MLPRDAHRVSGILTRGDPESCMYPLGDEFAHRWEHWSKAGADLRRKIGTVPPLMTSARGPFGTLVCACVHPPNVTVRLAWVHLSMTSVGTLNLAYGSEITSDAG